MSETGFEDQDRAMSLVDHLDELRQRLIKCLIAVGAGFIVCYIFSKQIFNLLLKPLLQAMPEGSSLIFIGVPEAFFTYLKVGFIAGIFVSSPIILYQLWRFVSPGLYKSEKRYMVPFVFFSTIFFIGGALFGYFVVFPFGFEFFMNFATENIRPFPSIKEYLSFAAKLMFAFGIVFELPLFTFFLAKAGIIDKTLLARQRRYALVLVFIFAAILTPPDVVTQLLMAGPLIILYELSVLIAKIFGRPAFDERQ